VADALAERVVHQRADRIEIVGVDAGTISERHDGGDGDVEVPRIRWQHQADLVGHALTLAHDARR